jgi:hypothetical protein
MIETGAVMTSEARAAGRVEALERVSGFRRDFYGCLTRRGDALFELTDAVLCAPGPVTSLPELSLVPVHRRGHGAMYDALACGRVEFARLRKTVALTRGGSDRGHRDPDPGPVQPIAPGGAWGAGDPPILIAFDAGYDVIGLSFLLTDLPVLLVARIRSDRVLRGPAPAARCDGRPGRRPRHGPRFRLDTPATWGAPTANAAAAEPTTMGSCRSSPAPS